MLEYLKVGLIGRPHGVRGCMHVQPLCDDPQTRYAQLETVYLKQEPDGYAPIRILDANVRAEDVLLTLEGVTRREQAQRLCGEFLYVNRASAAQLPADANFICDLEGCMVSDTRGNALGKLTRVLQTGAVDVYVVREKEGELLFPALKRLILEVDVRAKRILVDAAVLEEVGIR